MASDWIQERLQGPARKEVWLNGIKAASPYSETKPHQLFGAVGNGVWGRGKVFPNSFYSGKAALIFAVQWRGDKGKLMYHISFPLAARHSFGENAMGSRDRVEIFRALCEKYYPP